MTADCAACSALCCIAFAFDQGPDFALDKPAGQPCPHLARHRCEIHDQLDSQGFSGCIRYHCGGAGQRTRALFAGRTWQDDPALLRPQLETFRYLRKLHDLIALLDTAGHLALPRADEARRRVFLRGLCPDEMTAVQAEALASGPLPGTVRRFLKTLRPHARKRAG